jgi:hypothetical protein
VKRFYCLARAKSREKYSGVYEKCKKGFGNTFVFETSLQQNVQFADFNQFYFSTLAKIPLLLICKVQI